MKKASAPGRKGSVKRTGLQTDDLVDAVEYDAKGKGSPIFVIS